MSDRSSTLDGGSPVLRRYWEGQAAAVVRKVAVGAWLARFGPAAFFAVVPFAMLTYALRRLRTPAGDVGLALLAAVIAVACMCAWRARRHLFRQADARVLLESELRLDTRLTAAAAGYAAWPALPATAPRVLRWQLASPSGWLAGAASLYLAAALLPVPDVPAGDSPTGKPPALAQVESMLEALREMNVAEPAGVEQLEARAAELAGRPQSEQFSHSALEAADALRNQTAAAATELSRSLDAAAGALQSADASPDMSGSAGRLAAALSGLRDGSLPANKELLSKLPQSGQELLQLTPQQREQLAQELRQCAGNVAGVGGAAGANARVAQPDPNALEGWDTLPGGAGGPGGGGPGAPLMLSSVKSDAGAGEDQVVAAQSLKNAALGDKLGTSAGAHEVDPASLQETTSAGSVSGPAQGGDAVWVNRLTPAERATLKQFFK